MRKLASFHFMSLDGVVESPDKFVSEPLFDDIVSVIRTTIDDQDGVILGRALYEEWADYWPSSPIEPFASFINPVRKYVASTTLTDVAWSNATLLEGELGDAILELKNGHGGTLCVHGSIHLTHALLQLRLIDEIRLLVFPVLAGQGRKLLDRKDAPLDLLLTRADQTPLGLNYLVYRPIYGG